MHSRSGASSASRSWVIVLGFGRPLYAAMGGSGDSLAAALTYSNVVFSGAILVWLFNSLANVIRGTGNMMVPAIVTCTGTAVLVPLSPCLIFGWGPLPQLGIAGGAVAVIAFYALGSVAFLAYLWTGRSIVRLVLRRRPAAGVVLGHSARRHGRRADHRRNEPDHRHRDRAGRTIRPGGDRRLRHRIAHRVSPHPAGVRARRPAGRHGGDQHRRGQARPRGAHGVDRRRHRGSHVRDHRPRGGGISRRLAVAVRYRSRR